MTRSTAGLTLVEAAIVLAVISFGLSVALPAYRDHKVREAVELVIRAAAPAQVLVDDFASTNARLPDSAEIALPFPTLTQVRSTVWAGSAKAGTITITIASANGDPGELGAKAIVLAATYNPLSRQVDWTCGRTKATTVSPRYLPVGCQ